MSIRIPEWNDQNYDIHHSGTEAIKSQSPLVAIVGGLGNLISIQFVLSTAKVVRESVPIRGISQAIGIASDALMNGEKSVDGFALASTLVKTIGGGQDEANAIAKSNNILYGPSTSSTSDFGFSSSWNGLCTTTQASTYMISFKKWFHTHQKPRQFTESCKAFYIY